MRKKAKKKKDLSLRELSRESLEEVFLQDLSLAKSGSDSIAARQARDKVYELAGADDAPKDYEIDLNLIEIDQNDAGKIVTVKRELPNLDSSLPMRTGKPKKAATVPAAAAATPADPKRFFAGTP